MNTANLPQPLPGGYVFQAITPELVAVLRRADSTLARLIPIAEKYVPKLLQARTEIGRKIIRARMAVETAVKVRESRDDSAVHMFIMTHEVERSTQLFYEGRESLLRAARLEFQGLTPGEFDLLARQSGEYFGLWIFGEVAKRGAR
jgi:hypothetical protein